MTATPTIDEALDARLSAYANLMDVFPLKYRGMFKDLSTLSLGEVQRTLPMGPYQCIVEERALRNATPFIWAPAVVNAVSQAGAGIPLETTTFSPEWLHAPSGWWWLGSSSPLFVSGFIHDKKHDRLRRYAGQRVLALNYLWDPGVRTLVVTAYVKPPCDPINLHPVCGTQWREGEALPETFRDLKANYLRVKSRLKGTEGDDPMLPEYGDIYETDCERLLRFFAAGSLWLGQRILVASDAPATRHARKRSERAGVSSVTKVIHLRRTQHQRGADEAQAATESGREYHCQWVVRGHWRQQFYRRTGDHRPIWIMPFVKGPDDKPLKTPQPIFIADR